MGLNGDLGAREVLIGELREAAEPLRESCSPEVGERVDAAVNEAIQAWEDTRAELDALCTKYQRAVRLWEQYREASAAVKSFVDTQMGSITNLPPEEAVKQVKVCEETLAEHKERLAELRGLVAQIASDVGLDVDGPLHCEVEALGRRLEDVRETLSTLADTADARALNKELARGDLCQTKNFLDSVQQSLTTLPQGESKEQLNLLRKHLVALTKTEPQLQSIKERSLEAVTQEPSVVEVLQLWQRVFRETFQQYHRLSARLVRSEDVSAALRLWQEYLSHVQEFLSSNPPGDYNGLSEHRNLCEVHKNLLTDQQHLILSIRAEKGRDLSVAEQFNALTNLHNETLSKIMDRHASVRDRLDAWDRYREDLNKLLAWLKDIEREKSRLQLRFIHLRRLDKILTKIDILIERLPTGESQMDSLLEQQEALLADCEQALAVSVRMEHAANLQRVNNVRASLETWKDFVIRIRNLNAKHVDQTSIITKTFTEVSQSLSSAFHAAPGSLLQAREQLDSLSQLRMKLIHTSTDLETLGVTTEQLRECLSPSDMKSLNQHVSLLWQQHGDLEHQLALLAYRLGERVGLRGKWEKRLSRFLIWLTDAEIRMHSCDSGLEEPEEALKRLEGELHAEMALKQRELDWLQSTGEELIQITELGEKEKLKDSLDEVVERWTRLMNTGKARANKLIDLMQTMSSLERRIAEIRAWLGRVEMQLTEPFIVETKTQETINNKLKDHEQLQKTIEAESGNIGEVLNLCEILLSDCDAWKTSFNTEAIRAGMQGLEKRWKSACVRSADRKRKITTAWKLIQELDRIEMDQETWVAGVERELSSMEESLDKVSKEDSEQTMNRARRVIKDVDAHRPALQILEGSYSRLAKGGLEPENMKSLTAGVRIVLDRWHGLKPRANAIINALQREQKAYREFITAHGSAVVGLTQIDVRLTQVQHLMTDHSMTSRRRLSQVEEIERELEVMSETLQRADQLALSVMRDCHSEDVHAIQELVDEYQLLWQDIKSRVAKVKSELEVSERREVDEAVQVETLKFEQDSAVQVDTLPRLIRMTSCDAYLMELEAAIEECRGAMEGLEDAVAVEPVAGPGLAATGKNIGKLIASCQSAMELARHLHGLLIQDDKFDDDTARGREVEELGARYEGLLKRAREREQQIRDIRSSIVDTYTMPCEHDGGRLTCPLCCRRNWAQLDIDLWRLEKWLEYAEGTQSEQHSPPGNIEELEDIIQDHREFLLDLDSHRSIVVSLNIVGTHLADHTEDVERAQELRNRLTVANSRWEKVCQSAASWQEALQSALMSNQQFHRIVDELVCWLERTEASIRASEPIDLTENTNIIRSKYEKFRELRSDLERCEPRVLSLQDAANQLLEEHVDTRGRLQELRLRLQSLRRLTGIYALKLGAALGLDPKEVGLAATTSSLAALSQDLLDGASTSSGQPLDASSIDGDERDRTVLVRGYRFLGRVLRASLPIQALMLLLLGVASLVPAAEDDYSCMLSNNFARTFTPVVDYPNGPPPL
ncbi:muscle-specific protein 300 kDa-like isoform X3 [Diachasmimorpha longicaudata]|uniref:muscle-specific protein 300 kDa-like isoform X2 n=1 Tax=Diachasmimorpha longicaudata TaxID=58733 RepID=UPI0030B889CC